MYDSPNIYEVCVGAANFGQSLAKYEEEVREIVDCLSRDDTSYLLFLAQEFHSNENKLVRILDFLGMWDKPARITACERLLRQRGIPKSVFYH